jgi:hypothetical protein
MRLRMAADARWPGTRPSRTTRRAVAELKDAASGLQACGALRYRGAAERELRRLGHRIHRRTRPAKFDGTGVEALAGRELQVARLVVDRRTNPEIAEALFLSPKRSRRTCETSSASSTCLHASRSRAWSSAPIAPRAQSDVPVIGRVAVRPACTSICRRVGKLAESPLPPVAWKRQSRQALSLLSERTTCERDVPDGRGRPQPQTKAGASGPSDQTTRARAKRACTQHPSRRRLDALQIHGSLPLQLLRVPRSR